MDNNSVKNKARVKLGIPSIVEAEFTREWQDLGDNVLMYGDLIAVRVCDGTYWQVNIDTDNKVMALAHEIKGWEIIQIVAVGDEFISIKNRPVRYNDKVAFRFVKNNRFVGSNSSVQNGELTANVTWVKPWEMFTLMEYPERPMTRDNKVRYGSWFSLLADNQKYVMFDKGHSKQLMACASKRREWEGFVVMQPSIITT